MSILNVIIETPKGSAQKYDFDSQTGYFKLNKIMPEGLVFPYDFGFIEGTIGEDGDPLDVIVISEIKTFPGCAVDCRIIGAIKANQQERDGKKMRNDRYIAIPEVSSLFGQVKELKDLPKKILDELEHFFTNYNQQAGKKFMPFERQNAKAASAMLNKAKQQNSVKTKLIQMFLPITNEIGKPYPQKYFDAVEQKLTAKFKGLSVYESVPIKGKWKPGDAQIIKDSLLVFEIMADEFEIAYWEKYKQDLQKQFKQQSILIRCLNINLI